MLFLLALSTLVVIIVVIVAVVVKRKAACKQKRDMARRDEEYSTAVIVKREMEMKEKSVDSDYDYVGYKDTDDVNPDMAADRPREVHISTRRPAPNVSSFLAGASNTAAGSETADVGCLTASNVHYSIPMKDKMTNKRDGLIGNGIVVKEEYDDTIETRCKAEAADSECWQLNEKGYKVWKFSSQS